MREPLGTEFQHCAGCGRIWDYCKCCPRCGYGPGECSCVPRHTKDKIGFVGGLVKSLPCVYWQDGRPCINKDCYNRAWIPVCPELPNYNKARLDQIEKIADGILAVKPDVGWNLDYVKRIKIAAVIVDYWNMFKGIMEDETDTL